MNAIRFNFQSPLSVRCANLITGDLEALATKIAGKTITYTQFPKPMKGQLADWLCTVYADKLDEIEEALPELEAKRKAYDNRTAGAKGRPITDYIHDTQAQGRDGKNNSVAIDDDVPPPTPIKKPTLTPVSEDGMVTEDVNMDDDELAKEIARMLSNRKAPMDEDKVRLIAQQEGRKCADKSNADLSRWVEEKLRTLGSMPTRIEITTRDDEDNVIVVKDLGIQHTLFPELIEWVSLRDEYSGYPYPVWLPGPAGSGKTTAAKNVSVAFGCKFYANGAIDTEYKLLGFRDAGGTFHETPFYLAYKYGGVYLFDEVDASNPQALVAMNMALENGQCTFGNGEIVTRHKDCYVIAAANTYGAGATSEYVGRNKLDAATVDRFNMLSWDYDETMERALAGNDEWGWVDTVQKIRKVMPDIAKHVVSPRASIRGLAALRKGMKREKVIQAVVFKGLSADQQRQVMNRIAA